MAARPYPTAPDDPATLPVLERLAPAPSAEVVAAWIDRHSRPGDTILDLHARGGWIARAAIDRQRRAVSLESGPLPRLLAEIVLRPPDVRHLDAALQALSASPRGDTSLRLAIVEPFVTRCATCGRSLVIDDVVWEADADGTAEGAEPVPTRKLYRCTVCRDQQGGGEHRQAPLDDEDRRRGGPIAAATTLRRTVAERFPVPADARGLADELLALHTDRQLVGLAAILERIEGDLRAAPVEAALRLAFLHALLPASRLATPTGRVASLRVSNGHVRVPAGPWRERNPWLAFEEAFRLVRAFVQALESGPIGALQARFGDDVRSLTEGVATAVVRIGTPSTLGALDLEARDLARRGSRPRLRLVLAEPPVRPSQDRLALAFHGTAWALGRDAAATLPVDALLGPPIRPPWSWQAATLQRSLGAVEPLLERDGRAVILLESGGAEAVASAVLGGIGAGFRLLDARLAEPGEDVGGSVELLPPGAALPPVARTRSNVALPPLPGGAGDPELVSGRGIFAPPERYDARPFSAADAARTVTETAVEVLKSRGEPARMERLLGEILVGLDRAGQLRRLVDAERPDSADAPSLETRVRTTDDDPTSADRSDADEPRSRSLVDDGPSASTQPAPGAFRGAVPADAPLAGDPPRTRRATAPAPGPDRVERLVALIRDELERPTQRRLVEIEPGRWWLADREDRASAAVPLADRVEWAVYSLLSTAGPLTEAAFFDRIAALFGARDLPDETLVRVCLESYRSREASADRLTTAEDVLRRSHEHGELLAALAEGGHRLGMQVWLASREQARKVGDRRLGDWLDERERSAGFGTTVRGPGDAVEAVDCIWYVRGRAAFLFEVEWTAMVGEPVLRRHGRIPQDEHLVRFLVVPAARTELLRHKLERSPVLRASLGEGNWHILKWEHLRGFLAADELDLSNLEPLLGLDPAVERTGEQLPLF